MTRVFICSDPHGDYSGVRVPREGYDLAIVAGDISDGVVQARKWLLEQEFPSPTLFVLGNHDLFNWGLTIEEAYKFMDPLRERGIYLLSSGVIAPEYAWRSDDGCLAVIGDTLWTDFELLDDSEYAMEVAGRRMPEHGRAYVTPVRAVSPQETRMWHYAMSQRLREAAKRLKDEGVEKVVVVTHHAPHALSSHDRIPLNAISAAYCSHLLPTEGWPEVDLWVHGHVHDFKDYTLGTTRVVHNPINESFTDFVNPVFIVEI